MTDFYTSILVYIYQHVALHEMVPFMYTFVQRWSIDYPRIVISFSRESGSLFQIHCRCNHADCFNQVRAFKDSEIPSFAEESVDSGKLCNELGTGILVTYVCLRKRWRDCVTEMNILVVTDTQYTHCTAVCGTEEDQWMKRKAKIAETCRRNSHVYGANSGKRFNVCKNTVPFVKLLYGSNWLARSLNLIV